MVQPKGWGDVKPYYWCDNEHTRAVLDHLWNTLIHHPENSIYIKGTQKFIFNSIEIGCIDNSNIININICITDEALRVGVAESVSIVMDDAFINNKVYTLNSKEHFKKHNTFNLQYIWQPKDKK